VNTFWRDAIERGDLTEASALLGRGADVDALDRTSRRSSGSAR
jgi:hypothetical protein